MEKDVFDYGHYKDYVNDRLDDSGRGGGYGSRARLARKINCQTSYVAQVLNGSAHFSLEQIEAVNEFFGHGEQEGFFLLTLLQFERAGSAALKNRFKKQLDGIRDSRLLLKNRLGIKQPMALKHQVVYYSSWHYSAIHVMASQPRFHSAKAMAEHLGMDMAHVNGALQFLLDAGLIMKKGSGWALGKSAIHLGSDSPLISRHHINWRLQAVRALEKTQKENLHYSSVNTLSKDDAMKVREILTKAIGHAQTIIRESPEEEIWALSADLFSL